jgi:hypothetical protein
VQSDELNAMEGAEDADEEEEEEEGVEGVEEEEEEEEGVEGVEADVAADDGRLTDLGHCRRTRFDGSCDRKGSARAAVLLGGLAGV